MSKNISKRPLNILDATFGEGHYTRAFLETFDSSITVMDRDPLAYQRAMELKEKYPFVSTFTKVTVRQRLYPIQGSFGKMQHMLSQRKFDAIVFDIGMSSNQIEDHSRGFSFQSDGPLDMRMESTGFNQTLECQRDSSITAEAIVNGYSESDLADILFHFGEERNSKKIAKKIGLARQRNFISTPKQLANIIASAFYKPGSSSRPKFSRHPATKSFQALRIYINDELSELQKGLIAAEHLLNSDGLLIVVSFHSLEDRISKTFMKASSGHRMDLIENSQDFEPSFKLVESKAHKPSWEEIQENPRARSARVRAAIRTETGSMSHLFVNMDNWWKKDVGRNIHALKRANVTHAVSPSNESDPQSE